VNYAKNTSTDVKNEERGVIYAPLLQTMRLLTLHA
jgi:hypothetical protein